ncbi:hypothetical protein GCM10010299_46040 [Streptomyces tanashiensis]|nr:hypothetical protein GCM10010299_46040 [Streptomyces tanashiensis]
MGLERRSRCGLCLVRSPATIGRIQVLSALGFGSGVTCWRRLAEWTDAMVWPRLHEAHRNDVTRLIPLLQTVPSVRGSRGRPRCRPDVVLGDRGYDHDKYRRLVWDLGVKPLIARRGTEHGSGLGTQRWAVERAFAHPHGFRRLRIRWEIRDDIHEAFLTPGCALICWLRLSRHVHSSSAE